MELLGLSVKHKIFGHGIIAAATAQQITVQFDKISTVKIFPFPSCFQSYLTVEDPMVQNQLKDAAEQEENALQKQHKELSAQMEADYNYHKVHTRVEKSKKTVSVQTCNTVEAFCDLYQNALKAEMCYLKNKGGKKQTLLNGHQVEYSNGVFVYSFESEDELHYPDDTPISVWKGTESVRATVIQCIDFTILISTTHGLGQEIPSIAISAEPWQLISYLNDRLAELRAEPTSLVRSLICDGKSAIDPHNSSITTGQENARKMSLSQPITFVWGPPGTGKTETLAKIALDHIEKGHRVLMVSYSNVSVDGAILRVNKLSSADTKGVLVRYGYPRQPELLNHPYLTSYQLTLHHYPQLVQERQKLVAEQKKIDHKSPRYLEITRRLKEIKNTLSKEEKQAVSSAMFVATTVSKAVMDNTINQSIFDTVIFDEASMAFIPQIIFAASLAKSSFVCLGDFMQLPPIVQEDQANVLSGDIFQYCGITSAVESHRNHRWLCLLDTQYRMHPQIADFASNYMYRRLLKTAPGIAEDRKPIVNTAPVKGDALGFADLSGMMSVCTKTADQSRVNILSAFITASLAVQTAKKYPVGVISPYHAQSRLMHAISRDLQMNSPELKLISCATVHQFQGSEKDVVIYDAVDCYRMKCPGVLLTSMQNNYANRLFNVALTRAKGKFVGVGNIDYFKEKRINNDLLFGRLISSLEDTGKCIHAEQLIKPKDLTDEENFSFYNEEQGNNFLGQDIMTAEEEIHIDIPDNLVNGKWIDELARALAYQKEQGLTVIVRAEDKSNLPVALRKIAIESPLAVNPLVIIDKAITWFGAPSSNAYFIAEGYSHSEMFRPMIRFYGRHTAIAISGFAEMSQVSDFCREIVLDQKGDPITNTFSSYILANMKCPDCGNPLQLKKNKRGNFFLSCSQYPKCKGMTYITPELVEDYFSQCGRFGKQCPQCGCSLEAKVGPYGLYVQCGGIPTHRYKLDEI